MYRGPSRGPCIGIIYTHPSRVGGIYLLFLPTPRPDVHDKTVHRFVYHTILKESVEFGYQEINHLSKKNQGNQNSNTKKSIRIQEYSLPELTDITNHILSHHVYCKWHTATNPVIDKIGLYEEFMNIYIRFCNLKKSRNILPHILFSRKRGRIVFHLIKKRE